MVSGQPQKRANWQWVKDFPGAFGKTSSCQHAQHMGPGWFCLAQPCPGQTPLRPIFALDPVTQGQAYSDRCHEVPLLPGSRCFSLVAFNIASWPIGRELPVGGVTLQGKYIGSTVLGKLVMPSLHGVLPRTTGRCRALAGNCISGALERICCPMSPKSTAIL